VSAYRLFRVITAPVIGLFSAGDFGSRLSDKHLAIREEIGCSGEGNALF